MSNMEYGAAPVAKKLEARFTIWASNPHTRGVFPLVASKKMAFEALGAVAGMVTLRATDRLVGSNVRYRNRGLAARFDSNDSSSADAACP